MSHSKATPNKKPVTGITGGKTITSEWSGGDVIAAFFIDCLLLKGAVRSAWSARQSDSGDAHRVMLKRLLAQSIPRLPATNCV
jgi:hypothetical protein